MKGADPHGQVFGLTRAAISCPRPRPGGSRYNRRMDTAALDHLTTEQRARVIEDEKLWRLAHELATAHPGVDAGGIYHVLRNLKKAPADRLRAALDHGRAIFRLRAR